MAARYLETYSWSLMGLWVGEEILNCTWKIQSFGRGSYPSVSEKAKALSPVLHLGVWRSSSVLGNGLWKLHAAAGEIRCGPYHYGRHSCCFRTVAHVERCCFERWLVWRSVAVGSKRLLFPVRPSVDYEFIIS